jgi:hypothetical protein
MTSNPVVTGPGNRQRENQRYTYLLDGLLLLALCLLFFWRDLTPNLADRVSFAQGDFSNQFYAFAHYEASRLLAGQLPLWNPYAYAGHPFLADVQSAVFYPLSLLTMALQAGAGQFSYQGLLLEALLHYPLVALSTYLLVRRWTDSRTGGLVAAVVFTFSGYLTSYPPLQLAVLEVQAWIPLLLLLWDLAATRLSTGDRRSALGWTLGAGLVLGISTLAGHPQSTLLVLYGSMAFALFRLFFPWPSQLSRRWTGTRLGLLALFLAVGLGVAAVQILPSVEFLRLSTRAGASFEEMGSGFTPYDLLQLVLPAVGVPWPALFVGVLPLGLALTAVVRYLYLVDRDSIPVGQIPRRALAVFWAGLGFLALLISFGKHLPVYQVFYLLAPGWRLFRHQERVIVWTVLALAVLAGFGAAWLCRRQGRSRQETRLVLGVVRGYWIATLIALILAALFFWGYQSGRDSLWGFTTATLFLATMLALSGLAMRSRRAWIVIGVIVLDLFTVAPRNHQGPFTVDPLPLPSALAESLSDGELLRIANEDVIPEHYGMVHGLEEIGGASPLKLASYDAFLDQLPQELAWELLNVGFVLTSREVLDVPAELVATQPLATGTTAFLHRLRSPGARAWLAGQALEVTDPELVWQRMAQPDFDPRNQVVLSEPPAGLIATEDGTPCGGDVIWQEHSPERLVLSVTTDRPCVLVLSELAYPGWQATVDGQEAPILLANGLLRALALQSGSHEITLVFRPTFLALGGILSALFLAVTGLLLAVLVWRRRS